MPERDAGEHHARLLPAAQLADRLQVVVPAQAEAAQLRPHLLRLHARLRAAAPRPDQGSFFTDINVFMNWPRGRASYLRRALSPKPSCASTRLQARRSKCLTGPTAPPASVLSRTLHASRQRGGRPRAPAGTCAGGTPRGSRPSAAHPQSAARSGRRAACGCGVPPRPWAPGRLRQEGRPCHRLRAQRRAPPLVTGYKSPGQSGCPSLQSRVSAWRPAPATPHAGRAVAHALKQGRPLAAG